MKSRDDNVSYSWGFTVLLNVRFSFCLQFFYAPIDVFRSGKEVVENDSLFNFWVQLTYDLGRFWKCGGKTGS